MNVSIKKTVVNKVRFGEGNSVNIRTHFLTHYPMGLRIQECALSLSNNVEVKLVIGDDVVIKKQTIKKSILENPDIQKLKDEVKQMCLEAGTYLSNGNETIYAV
ncbi:hypothetical protein NC797_06880 [Aquibacillus sp. 3ASR75-11]|uniref:Uncharacterized protein n=1 Tax=Terrihalobacillus insolitus TaxID=2950438 RepID=A0A9X3WUH8_9BACI|nr:hypothetical protein [Terrihalobacillus insolitus]MDC3424231.1 hypothetical protein [Terrihalobacillus insolitus]